MRIFSIFSRGILQELRDPLTLGLTLFTTPFFIFFYWLLWGQSSLIHVGVFLPSINSEPIRLSEKNEDEIDVKYFRSKDDLIISIKNRKVEISILEKGSASAPKEINIEIENHTESERNDRIVYVLSDSVKNLILKANQSKVTTIIKTKQESEIISEFKSFVPGFLVFSIIMIVFSTTMMLSYEIESNLIFRYKISKTTVFEYLIGSGSIQFLNAAIAILLSITLTHFLGFMFKGNFLFIFLTCLLGALSTIGIGLWLASFLKNSNQAFLVSSFVMFLLLLFSGIFFPKPNVIVSLGKSVHFNLFDLLPTANLKQVIDGILLKKETVTDVKDKLLLILISSLFYLSMGILFFRRVFQKGGET